MEYCLDTSIRDHLRKLYRIVSFQAMRQFRWAQWGARRHITPIISMVLLFIERYAILRSNYRFAITSASYSVDGDEPHFSLGMGRCQDSRSLSLPSLLVLKCNGKEIVRTRIATNKMLLNEYFGSKGLLHSHR